MRWLLFLVEAETASAFDDLVLKDRSLDFQHALVLYQLVYLIYHVVNYTSLLLDELLLLPDVLDDLVGKHSFRDFQFLRQVPDTLVELLQVYGLSESDLQLLGLISKKPIT